LNYQLTHDQLIDRARSRVPDPDTYYEWHHVIPRCEGGDPKGETVPLTAKEHALVHYLRYKITGVDGNRVAYDLNKNCDGRARQAGILGGRKCADEGIGFYALSEEEKQSARDRGRETTVSNKLGMFSDDYRVEHHKAMRKIVRDNATGVVYESCEQAAKTLGVSPGTITYRIKSGKITILETGPIRSKMQCQ
jgi:hypothetical protein